MALGAIEQLIRAWASAKGVGGRRSLRPQEIASLIPQLGCSKALEELLGEICTPTTANIRGRVMHGGLLEVETQRTEALLRLVHPTPSSYRSPFSPENVCQLCLECLELLDQEAATVGITQKDFAWRSAFWLTASELDLGGSVYSEFLNSDEQAVWWEHLSRYLRAVAPNVKQFFTVGFMGWMGSDKDRLVRFMSAILIFESLYRIFVRRMKTKWGSCSPSSASVRFNTDLAKKPPECLEYIVVHELAHLIEPTHNDRFTTLLDRMMPNWRSYRQLLNQLPVRHENWVY